MKKRTVSLILCVLMVLTLIPVSSYAITGPQPNKATLKFETLTLMDGQEEMASTPVTDRYNVGVPDELNVGDVFYLGIKLCDMNNVPEFTDGLFSIAIPFEYNNTYLTWEGRSQANRNSNNRIDADTTGFYKVITNEETADEYSYVSDYGASGTRLTFKIDYSLGSKPSYNADNTEFGDEYIAITKFTVKALPEGTTGAKALHILKDDQLVAGFGTDSGSMEYSYGGSGKNDNFEWVMDFDDSGVNIFPETYTVSFDANGGVLAEGTEDINVKDGKTISALPDDPTQQNKFFSEWILDDNKDGVYNAADDTTPFTIDTAITADLVDENGQVKVFATWNDGYTITFDANQGHVQGNASQTTADVAMSTTKDTLAGETIPEVERTGYDLESWNTEKNGSGDKIELADLETHKFTAGTNAVLYAQWKPAADQTTATVTFDSNGGATEANPATKTVVSGQSIGEGNLPKEPTKDKYKFDSWNPEKNGSGTEFTEYSAVNGDITVYAQWIPADDQTSRTVTFDNGNQTGATPANPVTKKVVDGDSIGEENMPAYPTVDGYYCTGWKTADGDDFTGTTTVNADIIVYAQWAENLVITFNENGGSFNESFTERTVTLDATKKLKADDITKFNDAVTRDGYTFCGWYEAANGSGDKITDETEFTASVTVYARWEAGTLNEGTGEVEPSADAILVHFDANGGNTAPDPAMIARKPADALAVDEAGMPTAPGRTDYVFKEWNTQPNGEGDAVAYDTTAGSLVTGEEKEATVYAVWELDTENVPENERVTITFHKNDGTSDNKTITIKKGTTLNVVYDGKTTSYEPSFVRTPYTFVEWATANGVAFDFDTEEINTNLDVYARWSLAIDEVQFSGNEQTYDGTSKSITIDSIMVDGKDIKDDFEFEIMYAPVNDQTNKQSTVTDAGDYIVTIVPKAKGGTDSPVADVVEVDSYQPDNGFTIKQKGIPFIVGEQSVAVTEDNTEPKELSIEVNTSDASLSEAEKALTVNKTYYTFKDGVDKTKELTLDDLTALESAPTAQGDYVVSFTVSDSNYTASELKTADGGDAKVYKADANAAADKKLDAMTGVIQFSLVPDAKLEGLTVSVKNLDAGTVAQTDLYTSNELTDTTTFNKDTEGYYVTIPTNSDVVINLKGSFKPEEDVTYIMGGAEQTDIKPALTEGTTDEWTVTLPKDKLAVAAGEADKENLFKNVLEITIGSKTYTVKLKQQAKAKIVLNYGNSPYGEIMKDAAITDKEAAKAEFSANNAFVKDSANTPSSVKDIVDAGYTYGFRAWLEPEDPRNLTEDELAQLERPEINIDRDPNSIFVYYKDAFVDPGFTAVDSKGNPVTHVKRKIKLSQIKTSGYVGMADKNTEDKTLTWENGESELLIEEVTKLDETYLQYIRPDVYEMEYSFVDQGTNETVTAVRKVVLLSDYADATLDGRVNNNDTAFFRLMVNTNVNTESVIGVIKESSHNLYLYRMIDARINNFVDNNDSAVLRIAVTTNTAPQRLYVTLPKEK